VKKRLTVRLAVLGIFIKRKKILLLRRFNTGWRDGEYTLPAGHLEKGETIAKAMSRESFEETGLKIFPSDFTLVHTMLVGVNKKDKNDHDYLYFFLQAKKWDGTFLVREADKCDRIDWFPVKNLPKNILPHISKAVDCINKGIFFSEINWTI